MSANGPRILLIGGTYRALCVLERLLERGDHRFAAVDTAGRELARQHLLEHDRHLVCGHTAHLEARLLECQAHRPARLQPVEARAGFQLAAHEVEERRVGHG